MESTENGRDKSSPYISAQGKTYYLPKRRLYVTLVLLLLCFIVFVVGAPRMLTSHDARVQLVYFGLLLLPLICIPFVYIGMRNTRIITSPEGIIYQSSGYRIYSPWNNIAGRTLAISSSNSGMALRLKQPAAEMSISQGIEQDRSAFEIGRWMRWVGGNGYNMPRVILWGDFWLLIVGWRRISSNMLRRCFLMRL